MYTKDSRNKKVRLQDLHEIRESILEDDDDDDNSNESRRNDIFNELSNMSSDYRHIEYVSHDINIFYKYIYHYFVEGGITNIVFKHVLNMFMLFMTNIFMIYMFTYIKWEKLIVDCKEKENTINCSHLSQYISYNNSIHSLIILFNILSGIYICIGMYSLFSKADQYSKIKTYYNDILRIDNNILGIIKWSQILNKMKSSNDNHDYMIDKNSTELNLFDIITRITRIDNIILSVVNSDIIFKQTNMSYNILFTKYIETISRLFIFDNLFDKKYDINPIFKKKDLFQRYIVRIILLNIILLPFLLMYVVIINVLNHSKDIKNSTQLFNYKWSNYAKWKYREYNELEFEFKDRMFKSYFHMNKYISYFPDKTLNIFIYFIRFVLSMFILFLFVLSIIDDDALIKLKYHNYNLVWYFALLTITMGVLNSLLKEKNFEESIDKVIEQLTNYIHVLPPKDVIYNYQMYKSITKYYQSNITNIFYEIISVIISPYILYTCYYVNAAEIVQYLQTNTIRLENLGVVDKYSNFMLNYNIEDTLKHTIHDIRENKETTKENITSLILYKKREKSFLSFIDHYPNWKLYSTDLQDYVKKIQSYKDECSQDIPCQSMMFSSELMRSSMYPV